MLCRRCGMESSTTDVCEWCKKPILPPGAGVARRQKGVPPHPPPPLAAEPDQQEQAAEPDQQEQTAEPAEPAETPAAQAAPSPPADPAPTTRPPEEDVLRPLGQVGAAAPQPGAPEPGAPSHGLSDRATQTSVDLNDYTGPGGSIFKPIERATESAGSE